MFFKPRSCTLILLLIATGGHMEDELSFLKTKEKSFAVVCIMSAFGRMGGKLC